MLTMVVNYEPDHMVTEVAANPPWYGVKTVSQFNATPCTNECRVICICASNLTLVLEAQMQIYRYKSLCMCLCILFYEL